MFSYVSPDTRIPVRHPLRPIKAIVSKALAQIDRKLERLYSSTGHPSIAPERLIRALLLQVLYTIRSERLLVEQLKYNLLFRWFVGLSVDESVWDHSTFSKNRDRFLEADIARELFENIIEQARVTGLLSDEHFSVDGTLIQAWASHRSFRPKDDSDDPPGGGRRNTPRDYRGEQRSNDTHTSTTGPEAKLYKKSPRMTAKLCYIRHAVSENRHGLAVDARVTEANGTAERTAALAMLEELPSSARRTVAADKAYETRDFIQEARELNVTPRVAQNNRTTRWFGDRCPYDAPHRIPTEYQSAQDDRGGVRLGQGYWVASSSETHGGGCPYVVVNDILGGVGR